MVMTLIIKSYILNNSKIVSQMKKVSWKKFSNAKIIIQNNLSMNSFKIFVIQKIFSALSGKKDILNNLIGTKIMF